MNYVTEEQKENGKPERWTQLLLFLASFGYFMFYGFPLSAPWNSDEIATLANGALVLGYNWWTDIPQIGDVYFKYLLGVIYAPCMALFSDPQAKYQAMMTINALMAAVVPLLIYRFSRRFFGMEKWKAVFSAVSVGTLPMTSLYAKYAKPDVMLTTLAWVILYCLLSCGQAREKADKKRVTVYSILIALLTGAAYMAHTRGIVFILAVTVVLAGLYLFQKIRIVYLGWYGGVTAVLLVLDHYLTRFFKQAIWPFGTKRSSMDAFRLDSLKEMATFTGIKVLAKTVIGWLYTLFTCTWGIAALGLAAGLFLVFRSLSRKREYTTYELIMVWFAMVAFFGTCAMGLLFFFPHVYKVLTGLQQSRGDWLVYERYMATVAGPVCFVGWYFLWNPKKWPSMQLKILSVGSFGAVLAVFSWKIAGLLSQIKMICISTLAAVLDLKPGGGNNLIYSNAYLRLPLFGLFSLFILLLVVLVSSGKRCWLIGAAATICVNAALYQVCYQKSRYKISENSRLIIRDVYQNMNEFAALDDGLRNVYFDAGLSCKNCQLALLQFHIYNKKAKKYYKDVENSFLIQKSDHKVTVDGDYCLVKEFQIKNTEYSLYAKGEELCRILEEEYNYELGLPEQESEKSAAIRGTGRL